MKIFRVQDSEGRGPWRPGFSHNWVIDRPDHANLPPWPFEFGLDKVLDSRKPNEWMGCGCLSLKQLRRWITMKEYRTLKKLGYGCVMLEGNAIAVSDIQCVFTRDRPLFEDIKKLKLYRI